MALPTRRGSSLASGHGPIRRCRPFTCGRRQLAAWLGLVPGRHDSGGKTRLGRITKAGDRYLRTLLVMGARSVLALAASRADAMSRWALALQARAGYGKAVVAIAAKNARLAWAMLVKGDQFRSPTAAGQACRPAG